MTDPALDKLKDKTDEELIEIIQGRRDSEFKMLLLGHMSTLKLLEKLLLLSQGDEIIINTGLALVANYHRKAEEFLND